GVDMHSHLIPGIDDGAKQIEESIKLIRSLVDMGYRKIITTPHIMGEYYPNTPETIRAGLDQINAALSNQNLEVEIEAAAEYYLDEHFEQLLAANSELLSFSGKHILVEFSMLVEPVNATELIFQLKTRGYQPILAHPERYLYFEKNFEKFEAIHALGCEMQVNLLSLAGYYGKAQKRLGTKLLKSGMIDYLGTDLHRKSQIEFLRNIADKEITKLIRSQDFKNNSLV
ncbi:MAG: CpsB/CapC family capsule biosynthesis tyrosine phosphatase, partial [Bacteroidota bacterium]